MTPFYSHDRDGFRYLDARKHERATLLSKMSQCQRQAVILMEKWGWTLARVYDDKRQQVIMTKPNEHNTAIYRN